MIPGAVHRHARRKLQLAGRVETPRRHQALLLPLRKHEARLARGDPPVPQERLAVDPLRLRLPCRKGHSLGVAAAPESVRLQLALDLPRPLGEVLQVLVLEAGDPRDPLPPGAAVLVATNLVAEREKFLPKLGLVDLVREPLRTEDPPRVDRPPLAVRAPGDVQDDAVRVQLRIQGLARLVTEAGGDHVPPRAPLVEALAVRHQDLAARGVFALQQPREVVRLDAARKPQLLGAAAVPARRHDALALPLGVVVPEREFAPVVVARLADRQRRRRAQHDPSSIAPDPGESGPKIPSSAGDLCRVGARTVSPSDSPRLFQDVSPGGRVYYGRRFRMGVRDLRRSGGRDPGSLGLLRGSWGGVRPSLKNENHPPSPRAPVHKNTGARGWDAATSQARPRACA